MSRKLPKNHGICPSCNSRFFLRREQQLLPSIILTGDQRDEIKRIDFAMYELKPIGITDEIRRAAELRARAQGAGATRVVAELRRRALASTPEIAEKVAELSDDAVSVAWEAFHAFRRFCKVIDDYGVTQADAVKRWYGLSAKTGGPPTVNLLTLDLFNSALAKSQDHHRRGMVYGTMAEFLARNGKDPFQALRLSASAKLHGFREEGIARVRIINFGDLCSACKKWDGRVLTVEEAIKSMPIPCPDCTTRYDEEVSDHMWCQCSYEAVFDDE